MRAIGLDIGTTKLAAVVVDSGAGGLLEARAVDTGAGLSGKPWESSLDAAAVAERAEGIVNELAGRHSPIGCIGITGQMHGILYLDAGGQASSPLYTWRDGRGNLPYEKGLSYAEHLRGATGHPLATGYGAVTHFYNMKNGLVPPAAKCFCAIADYVAMRLTRRTSPAVSPSSAAGIGLFDVERGVFDASAIQAAGLDAEAFPPVFAGPGIMGATDAGIPVAVAIGDNQAGFLGSVRDPEGGILLNVGTGSQISRYTERYERRSASRIETRPHAGRGFLLVGAALCGGSAYALLNGFFKSAARMATGKEVPDLYDEMAACAAEGGADGGGLEVAATFSGTREDPALRGCIRNIGMDNFTPRSLILGVLGGIASELHDMHREMRPAGGREPALLVGSGNGIRRNRLLRRILSERFAAELRVPAHREEAALGAAFFALASRGCIKRVEDAQAMIRYEGEEP